MTLRPRRLGAFCSALTALAVGLVTLGLAGSADAARLAVDIWTDRGEDGVYSPGDRIEISTNLNDGAYLLVYEIDAEGYVHVLFPYERSDAYVEGPATLRLPNDETDLQLVTEAPAGAGYIVAIASVDPFESLPWYLRPYDANMDELGTVHYGDEDEENGVTPEGRIVGDPFVAMERIRRAVLQDDQDRGSFATSYTTYYVHERVKYPRYACYDCHRPGQWRWWDGFDPYYTTCSTFDLRVNVGWWWGPSYWFGQVPYYVYVYRTDCPPMYRHFGNAHYSSWNGWATWTNLWGPLRRYKSPAPAGYLPPSKYDVTRRWRETGRDAPPGILASAHQVRERRIGLGRGARLQDPAARERERRFRDFSEGRQTRGADDPSATRRERRGNGDTAQRERRGNSDAVPRERRGSGDLVPRERRGTGDMVPRERRGTGDVVPRERRGSGDVAPRRNGDAVPRERRGNLDLVPRERRAPADAGGFPVRLDRPRSRGAVPDPARGDRIDRWNSGVTPRAERRESGFPRSETRFDRPAPPRYDAPPRFERAPKQEAPRFEPPRESRQEAPRVEAPQRGGAQPANPPAPGRTSWGGGPRTKG